MVFERQGALGFRCGDGSVSRALRRNTVDKAANANATIRKGLRRPIRSDQRPIGNWARPDSAARVETIPMLRSESPFSPR